MNRPLQYALFDSGAPSVAVRDFPIASSAINELMPRLLAELNARAPLAAGIAAVHFLSTQAGDMLVSLIYAEPLHARWRDEALKMQRALKLAAVVGRAKGTCVKLPRDWVVESYALADGRRLRYQQLEGAFSNPSAAMAEHTLSWLCAAAADIVAAAAGSGVGAREPPSLLELYCGNGNHTVALAPLFKRLLAVEIDARLCAAAVGNLKENGVDDRNVRVLSGAVRALLRRAAAAHQPTGGRRRRPRRRRRRLRAGSRAARTRRVMRAAGAALLCAAASPRPRRRKRRRRRRPRRRSPRRAPGADRRAGAGVALAVVEGRDARGRRRGRLARRRVGVAI